VYTMTQNKKMVHCEVLTEFWQVVHCEVLTGIEQNVEDSCGLSVTKPRDLSL